MSAGLASPAGIAPARARAGAAGTGRGTLGLALVAALFAGLAAWLNLGRFGPGLPVMDPDSAMRLVQVRDLLGGQDWFDLTQHRLGLGGVEMHWSRLIDAPLAALILAGDLVAERATSERLALVIWPTIWLGVTFWACLGLGLRLGGGFGAAVTFLNGAVILLMTATFHPGHIDHHNVQLALLLLALWGFVARHESRAAPAASGLSVGTSLVVGVELLPVMAALCGVVAGTWAWRGRPERRSTIAFGAALVGAVTAGFLLTAPASAWTGGFCDAVSVDLLVPVVGGAVLLAVASATLSEGWPGLRLGVLGVAGGSLLAASLAVAPACLSNPLDRLDPLLVEHWLDHVSEARGLREVAGDPGNGPLLVLYLLGTAGIPIGAGMIRVGRSRPEMAMLLVLCAVTTALATYQIRYLPFAAVLGIPAWASLAAHLRRRSLEGGGPRLSAAAVVVFLLSSSYGLVAAKEAVWPQSLVGSPRSEEEVPAGGRTRCPPA